jgi:hypothetical protein
MLLLQAQLVPVTEPALGLCSYHNELMLYLVFILTLQSLHIHAERTVLLRSQKERPLLLLLLLWGCW